MAFEEPTGGPYTYYVHAKGFAGPLGAGRRRAQVGAAQPAIPTAGRTPYVAYLVLGSAELPSEIHVMYPQRLSPLALIGTKSNSTKSGVTFVVRPGKDNRRHFWRPSFHPDLGAV